MTTKHPGKKSQPNLHDTILIDRDLRSDAQIRQDNEERYERRRQNGKPECSVLGCETPIGYQQEEMCRRHMEEESERKAAARLAKA